MGGEWGGRDWEIFSNFAADLVRGGSKKPQDSCAPCGKTRYYNIKIKCTQL